MTTFLLTRGTADSRLGLFWTILLAAFLALGPFAAGPARGTESFEREPPPGCGAPEATEPGDCLRCHVVPGFDPSAAPAEALTQPTMMAAHALSSTGEKLAIWEILAEPGDPLGFRVHWRVNGYLMAFDLMRSDDGGATWSLMSGRWWPWGRQNWEYTFPEAGQLPLVRADHPVRIKAKYIYCSSGGSLCGTGWIYEDSAVLTVSPAGAGMTVEVLQNNDWSDPGNPARWGQETELDTWSVDASCPNHFTRIRYVVPGPKDVVRLRIENVHDPASPVLVYQDEDAQVVDGYFNWDGRRLVAGDSDRSQVPPGLYQVSVAVNGGAFEGSPRILLLGPDPLKSTVAADKEYLFIEDPDSAKIDVTLRDGKGQPLRGWAVEVRNEKPTGTLMPVTEASGVYSTLFDSGAVDTYALEAWARPTAGSERIFVIGQVAVTTLSEAAITADVTLCDEAPEQMAMSAFGAPEGMTLSAGAVCSLVFPSYVPIERVSLLRFTLQGLPGDTLIEQASVSVSTVDQGQGAVSGDKVTFQPSLIKTINQSLTTFNAAQHFWFKGTNPGSARISGTVTYRVPKGQSKTITAAAGATVIKAEVLSVDLVQDRIQVLLSPAGVVGNLTLRLTGGATHLILAAERTGNASPLNESLDIPSLGIGEYTRVEARWVREQASSEHSYVLPVGQRMNVLGVYRHSQYNTPTEEACGGTPQAACLSDLQCSYHEIRLLSVFIAETYENGSGASTNYGLLQWGDWCWTHGYPLEGACERTNTFGQVDSVQGSCGQLAARGTLAVNAGHPDLGCGDRVFIHTVGIKTITDACPACGVNQLDNYAGLTGCNAVDDLGNFMTIRVY